MVIGVNEDFPILLSNAYTNHYHALYGLAICRELYCTCTTIDVDLCTSGHGKIQRVSVLAERAERVQVDDLKYVLKIVKTQSLTHTLQGVPTLCCKSIPSEGSMAVPSDSYRRLRTRQYKEKDPTGERTYCVDLSPLIVSFSSLLLFSPLSLYLCVQIK